MTRRPKLPVHAASAPRQARSIKKRAKLLQAGRRLFGEKGYERTSVGDITSRAGTAAGTFYQHFPSKRELLLALMDELIGRLNSLPLRPTTGRDARAGLRRFLTAAFAVDQEYYGVVRGWQEAVFSDPELAGMEKEIEGWTQARILRVFQALHPRAKRDLAGFARMMDRHFWSLMARGSRIAPREIHLAADVIYFYLFGT